MALLQNIQSDKGVPATYWKISSVSFNTNGSCVIRLDGYYDEIARRDGYEPIKYFLYTVNVVDFVSEFPSGFNLVDAYAHVKTRSEFSFGSVDVL